MHVAETLDRTPRSLPQARRETAASSALRRLTAARIAYQRADDFWGHELRNVFGAEAGQARFERRGKGEDGTSLRFAHDQRERLRIVFEDAQQAYRLALSQRYGRKDEAVLADDVCRCRECMA